MNSLQKLGGIAALLEGAIYISAFVFFGAFWSYPADADSIQQFLFLAENQIILSVVYFTMYVLFGMLLAILILALHERLKVNSPILSQLASIFGVIWVGMVIASGMISNIGLAASIELSVKEPEQAMTIWRTINYVVEGIGGGNEIVGGLWVLLLSVAALKGKQFSTALIYLGMFVGIVGVLTIYPAEVLTEIFGVSQIVWFVWLGVFMLNNGKIKSNKSPIVVSGRE
ncbi:DUF4386 family protein [Alginatibacterium sediminis]|uniref:DUF4386 family protein n=1 Tax=Alginatibacterium sediminis TaxID=2164068 RepID=A0A420EDA6_9ALTE|nr:DUF4386 family protein [Alginatibacterium sediminis]RKF18687.1 DUF4386 family protein [Alginatibacterium sediminis]